jgi:hypothetical protein
VPGLFFLETSGGVGSASIVGTRRRDGRHWISTGCSALLHRRGRGRRSRKNGGRRQGEWGRRPASSADEMKQAPPMTCWLVSASGQSQRGFYVPVFNTPIFCKQCRRVSS